MYSTLQHLPPLSLLHLVHAARPHPLMNLHIHVRPRQWQRHLQVTILTQLLPLLQSGEECHDIQHSYMYIVHVCIPTGMRGISFGSWCTLTSEPKTPFVLLVEDYDPIQNLAQYSWLVKALTCQSGKYLAQFCSLDYSPHKIFFCKFLPLRMLYNVYT